MQVLPHRERRKDVPILRHVAEAQARDAIAGQAGDILALERMLPVRLYLAHDRLDGGRAADAVAAEQAHHLAGLDIEVHALEDVTFAVVGMKLPHLEHQCASCPR